MLSRSGSSSDSHIKLIADCSRNEQERDTGYILRTISTNLYSISANCQGNESDGIDGRKDTAGCIFFPLPSVTDWPMTVITICGSFRLIAQDDWYLLNLSPGAVIFTTCASIQSRQPMPTINKFYPKGLEMEFVLRIPKG